MKTKIQITFSLFLFFCAGLFLYFSPTEKTELDFSQEALQEAVLSGEAISNNETNHVAIEKVGGYEIKKEVAMDSVKIKGDSVVEDNKKENNNEDVVAEKITKLKIIPQLVSFGFEKASSRKIDTIIIHSSYDALGSEPYSVTGVIAEYETYKVSPHYLIDRKGKVYQLVEDRNVAYHAGSSKMPDDGREGVNDFSIGVEMLTTKTDKLTVAQYDALKLLIKDLKDKYKIKFVLGHNEIAPGRKDDPWNFDWKKLK